MESPIHPDLTPLNTPEDTEIIETFGFWPKKGAVRFEAHLARMAATAAALGIEFNPGAARAQVAALPKRLPLRVRLGLKHSGLTLTTQTISGKMFGNPDGWRVAIAPEVIDEDNPWRRVKTSHRGLYNRARANLPDGIDELIFLNRQGRVAEGSITNIFIAAPDLPGRKFLTPPVSDGALPGILRAEMLADGRAFEAELTPDDLRGVEFYCGNSFGNFVRAVLVPLPG